MNILDRIRRHYMVDDPMTQPCPDCWAEVGERCLSIGVSTDHLPEADRYMRTTHKARAWRQR